MLLTFSLATAAYLSTATASQKWLVCLAFSPAGELSTTELVLPTIPNRDLESHPIEGSFYGSLFGEALLTKRSDMVIFSATTADQSGTYFHLGRMEGNHFVGQSWSTGRGFLMPWTAYSDGREVC